VLGEEKVGQTNYYLVVDFVGSLICIYLVIVWHAPLLIFVVFRERKSVFLVRCNWDEVFTGWVKNVVTMGTIFVGYITFCFVCKVYS
jgi:hypothetical protein